MALKRLIKSGTFTVSIRVAIPKPIATNFNCTPAILAETFPPGLITSSPRVLYWLNHFEKSEGLACKVMFDLELGTATRFGFVVAETVRKDRYDISTLTFTNPPCFAWLCFRIFLYYCQFPKCPTPQINKSRWLLVTKTPARLCSILLHQISRRYDSSVAAFTLA